MSLIGKCIGNYEIKSKLGEGGMGTVYLGEHPLIGKRVAVKVLLEELAVKEEIVSRFFNEAKAVNDIGHQNIVDVVDFGKIKNEVGGDVVYFIMEFLEGESLATRLRRTGLAFNETHHIIAQCCSALMASHQKGIVHRDLKPENLYLCTRGTDKNFVKILDFGIAKLTGGDPTQSHKTRTGLVIGTPTYMSPEQCEGKGLVDHRSDVYSLGVVMYELLTGRVPFPGDGFGEILVAHLTRTPDRPTAINPDISLEIEAIVLHAIEKDRNLRFQSMDEFGEALADPAHHYAAYLRLPPTSSVRPSMGMPVAGRSSATTGTVRATTGSGQPRPTTLSGAAAQIEPAPVKKGRTPMFVGIAVVIVAGVVGLAAISGKERKEKESDPKPAMAVPQVEHPIPSVDEKVTITVTSEPSGAEVRNGTGDLMGKTPYDIEIKKGDLALDIEVRLEGYLPQKRTLNSDKSREIVVALSKDSSILQPLVRAPVKRVKPSKSRSKKSNDDGNDDMRLLAPSF
jgi:serine/threonine protein kinase